jgi:hypothetical protein
MATAFRSSKSITGAALVAFGIFFLYQNVAGAITCFTHFLANSSEALGFLFAAILAVSQGLQAHTTHRDCIARSVIQHMLQSSWPLLLVMVGTVLSKPLTDNAEATPKKGCDVVDLTSRHSTLK